MFSWPLFSFLIIWGPADANIINVIEIITKWTFEYISSHCYKTTLVKLVLSSVQAAGGIVCLSCLSHFGLRKISWQLNWSALGGQRSKWSHCDLTNHISGFSTNVNQLLMTKSHGNRWWDAHYIIKITAVKSPFSRKKEPFLAVVQPDYLGTAGVTVSRSWTGSIKFEHHIETALLA